MKVGIIGAGISGLTAGQLLKDKFQVEVLEKKDGFIKVNSLQFPGKKKMQTHELLNGITFSENAIAL